MFKASLTEHPRSPSTVTIEQNTYEVLSRTPIHRPPCPPSITTDTILVLRLAVESEPFNQYSPGISILIFGREAVILGRRRIADTKIIINELNELNIKKQLWHTPCFIGNKHR